MSTDEAYASFLDKANQDPSNSTTTTTTAAAPKPPPNPQHDKDNLIAQSTDIPPSLQNLDVTFTSESDEPFQPFTVPYEGSKLPDARGFAEAVRARMDIGDWDGVKELEVEEFDPRGEYGEVVEKTREAIEGAGDVKIFTVEAGRSRVVYFVVGLDGERRRLVGVRAVSVES